jgi:CDP-glycerol glycerophosphotransferase
VKVDRRNPRHWWRLALFACSVLASIVLRPLRRERSRRRVLFYGHRLAGNLLPIHRALVEHHGDDVDVAFLTMDPVYRAELAAQGVKAIAAGSLAAVDWLSTVQAVVSDHGLHAMALLLPVPGVLFFDVWHGIPFKGFDAGDFRVQHRFDEAWVASPLLERMYVERFGFDPAKVVATGYARTDQLAAPSMDRAAARREFALPEIGKVVLFAPTWQQDDAGRSVYPFGETEERFLGLLSAVARRHDATVVVRHHLNSGAAAVGSWPGIVFLPFASHPLTERLLVAVDVLVCDWSSIAFDFLFLERPAIFLDVPPPFRKPMSLNASFRYGAIAGDAGALERMLDEYLSNPEGYLHAHGATARSVREQVYGGLADGGATGRCVDRLLARLRDSAG